MESLIRKLEDVERKFANINKEMEDPVVAVDHRRFRELARTRTALEPVVELFKQFQREMTDLEEARKLLAQEKDPDMIAMATDEIDRIEEALPGYREKLQLMLLPRDPNDDKDTIVEVRAGTGGDEAALFAQEIYRMYLRYAEERGWKVDVLDSHPTGIGGMKEIIFAVKGEGVYSRLKFESGVHRVQRVPVTEAGGRIHTSAATVIVMPEADEVEVEINQDDLKIDLFCSSGPGGQSVNTTQSAVRITHLPTGIVVQCQDEKSQHKNRDKAMQVLRARLYDRMQQEQDEKISGARRSLVKSGDRSEKFRTYNFPQNRVTTHTIHFTVHNLDAVMEGRLDEIIDQMIALDQAEQLKNLE